MAIGVIEPGSMQWMTAGRSVIHLEMPEQTDGLLWGCDYGANSPRRDRSNPTRRNRTNLLGRDAVAHGRPFVMNT